MHDNFVWEKGYGFRNKRALTPKLSFSKVQMWLGTGIDFFRCLVIESFEFGEHSYLISIG